MDFLNISSVLDMDHMEPEVGQFSEAAQHEYRKRTHHFVMLNTAGRERNRRHRYRYDNVTENPSTLSLARLRRIGHYVRKLSFTFDPTAVSVEKMLQFLYNLYGIDQPHQLQRFRSTRAKSLTHLKLSGLVVESSTLATTLAIFTDVSQLIIESPKYDMTADDVDRLLQLSKLTHLTIVARSFPLQQLMKHFCRTNQLIVLNVKMSADDYELTAPMLWSFLRSMTKLQGFGLLLMNSRLNFIEPAKLELRENDFFHMLSKTAITHLILPYSDLRLHECPPELLAQLKTLTLRLDNTNVWSNNERESNRLMGQLCQLDTLRLISVWDGADHKYETKVHERRMYLGFNDFDSDAMVSTVPECIRTTYDSYLEAGDFSWYYIDQRCLRLEDGGSGTMPDDESDIVIFLKK